MAGLLSCAVPTVTDLHCVRNGWKAATSHPRTRIWRLLPFLLNHLSGGTHDFFGGYPTGLRAIARFASDARKRHGGLGRYDRGVDGGAKSARVFAGPDSPKHSLCW